MTISAQRAVYLAALSEVPDVGDLVGRYAGDSAGVEYRQPSVILSGLVPGSAFAAALVAAQTAAPAGTQPVQVELWHGTSGLLMRQTMFYVVDLVAGWFFLSHGSVSVTSVFASRIATELGLNPVDLTVQPFSHTAVRRRLMRASRGGALASAVDSPWTGAATWPHRPLGPLPSSVGVQEELVEPVSPLLGSPGSLNAGEAGIYVVLPDGTTYRTTGYVSYEHALDNNSWDAASVSDEVDTPESYVVHGAAVEYGLSTSGPGAELTVEEAQSLIARAPTRRRGSFFRDIAAIQY